MKAILGLFVLLFVVIVAIAITRNAPQGFPFLGKQEGKIAQINTHTFSLLVAKEEKEKEIGLTKTNTLPENKGMIFVFTKPDYYRFWTRDMKFAVDIIYTQNNRITTIIHNAPPTDKTNAAKTIYQPTEASDKVLEINAGLAKKYALKKGDTIQIKL